MVTNSITSFEAKIKQGERILQIKKKQLKFAKELAKILSEEAKLISGSEALIKEYLSLHYAEKQAEHETEVFIQSAILNEDKERYQNMLEIERQLDDRIPMLAEIIERIKVAHVNNKRKNQISKDDSSECISIVEGHADYINNPSRESAHKLLRRADHVFASMDLYAKRR